MIVTMHGLSTMHCNVATEARMARGTSMRKRGVITVKSTGFDGTWSSELLSPKHWEWDLREVAREARRLMVEYAS